MLELRPAQARVVVCLAAPEVLDGVPPIDGAVRCRISLDELLLIGAPGVLASASVHVAEHDPTALVVDHTDAFAIWTIAGTCADEAFCRLSAIPLPRHRPAFLQGLVAHVPTKVLVAESELHVLVPASVGHHLRDRLLAACRDLEPREGPPAPLRASALEPNR